MSELDDEMRRMRASQELLAQWKASVVTQNDPPLTPPPPTVSPLILEFLSRVPPDAFQDQPVAIGPDGVERLANPHSVWERSPSVKKGLFGIQKKTPGTLKPGVRYLPAVRCYNADPGKDGHINWSFYVFKDGRFAGHSYHLPSDDQVWRRAFAAALLPYA